MNADLENQVQAAAIDTAKTSATNAATNSVAPDVQGELLISHKYEDGTVYI